MLAFLLSCFAASLAFAQYLVSVQQRKPHIVPLLDPLGFTTVEPTTLEDEIQSRSGSVNGHPRFVQVFAWDAPSGMTMQQQINEAAGIFEGLTDGNPDVTAVGSILGQGGVEMSGTGSDGRFTFLRLAVIQSQAVAICYSGPTPQTDADKTTFNTLCATGIKLQK
jgi:hypothetical protein